MAKIFIFFVCAFTFLGALPQENGIIEREVSDGIIIWIKDNIQPRQMMSIRLIWQERGHTCLHSIDVPCGDFDEVREFFQDNEQKIPSDVEKVGIVVIGRVDADEVFDLCHEIFSQGTRLSVKPIEKIEIERGEFSTYELELAFPTPLKEIETIEDLRREWQIYLFQAVIQARFEKTMIDYAENWLHPDMTLVPSPYCSARISCGQDSCLEVLTRFLLGIQQIRTEGFTIEELDAVKGKMQKTLISSYRPIPDNASLATYLAEQLLLGSGCVAYDAFMRESINLIPEFSLKDVHELVLGLLLDDDRHIYLKGPKLMRIDEGEIMTVLENQKADSFYLSLDSINDERTGGSIATGVDPYSTLIISELEAQYIADILSSMANDGIFELLSKQGKLKEKGQRINVVHPMRFLGTVFSNPSLKKYVKEIRGSLVPMKWAEFIDGLSGRLIEEYSRNNLLLHVKGFSLQVGANPDKVTAFIQKRDWEGLVIYLMEI